MSQRIYAKIKKSSKHHGQTAPGERFEVEIRPHRYSEYVVLGNSNVYRLSDVNLFVVSDSGVELRIA